MFKGFIILIYSNIWTPYFENELIVTEVETDWSL